MGFQKMSDDEYLVLDRTDQNNNAAVVLGQYDTDANRWYGSASDLTLRDLVSFLGEEFESFSLLAHRRIDARLQTVVGELASYEQKATKPKHVHVPTTSAPIKVLDGLNKTRGSIICKLKNVRQNELDFVARESKVVPYNVVWDSRPPEPPFHLAQRLVNDRLRRKQDAFQKSVHYHWCHELKVYAKLGYWAPDLIPEQFRQALDSVTTANETQQQSTRTPATTRLLNATQNPCLQTNPSKRFLHKFGGLEGFYKHLREDLVGVDDLNLAIHLCPFGLLIGLKRTSINMDPRLLRRSWFCRATVRSSNVDDLQRMIASQGLFIGHQKQQQQQQQQEKTDLPTSLIELKGIINKVLLSDLSHIRPISEYQTTDTTPEEPADFAVLDTLQNEETEPISPYSASSEFISSTEDYNVDDDDDDYNDDDNGEGRDDEEEEKEVEKPPTSETRTADTVSHSTVSLDQHERLRQVDRMTESSSKRLFQSSDEMLDSNEVSSLETLMLDEHPVVFEMEQKGPARKPSTVIRYPLQILKFPKIERKSASSSLPTDHRAHSINSTGRKNVARSTLTIATQYNLVPDLREHMPVNMLVRSMIDQLQEQTKAKKQTRRASTRNNMVEGILCMAVKQQPVVVRVLRQQNLRLASTAERTSRTFSSASIPDLLALELREKNSKYMLPAVRLVQPAIRSDRTLHITPTATGTCRGSMGLRWSHDAQTTKSVSHQAPRISAPYELQYEPVQLLSPDFGKTPSTTSDQFDWSKKLTDRLDEQSVRSTKSDYSAFKQEEMDECKTPRAIREVFLLPPLAPKPRNILIAVRDELEQTNPFVLEYFLHIMRSILPEDRWQVERGSAKLSAGLERVGADLLLYRHSSGHPIRFKLMSILSASETNRILRRFLRKSAGLQGNWFDQLLRTLSSIQPSCRVEASLVITRLVTNARLMQQLLSSRKHNTIADILHSLFLASDEYPDSWPEFYMTIAFLLQYNQSQSVLDCLFDRTIQTDSIRAALMWPRLVAHVYTHWRKPILQQLSINEKRVCLMLDAAFCHPLTRKGAREAVAAISRYHVLNSKVISLWRPKVHSSSQDVSCSTCDYGVSDPSER